MTRIIFLHIPKTAGQTVHTELSRIIGSAFTSPVRVHTQADTSDQFQDSYTLYSGHLDWDTLPTGRLDQFAFTILRDPFERIASFYFYLHHKASGLDDIQLSTPANTGLRVIRNQTADDYFFGGDAGWKRFILDHYNNFYCSYLATQKIRGSAALEALKNAEILSLACSGAQRLDRIYDIANLSALEDDILILTAQRPQLVGTWINTGPQSATPNRWASLLARLECDANRQRLGDFAELDLVLMARLKVNGVLV